MCGLELEPVRYADADLVWPTMGIAVNYSESFVILRECAKENKTKSSLLIFHAKTSFTC